MSFAKAIELALRTGRGEGPRVAMCPTCPDEVLVSTLHWPGAEFYCLGCEGVFSYVDPRPAEETPELLERIETTMTRFRELLEAGKL